MLEPGAIPDCLVIKGGRRFIVCVSRHHEMSVSRDPAGDCESARLGFIQH